MRSPVYSAHPVGANEILPPDRYSPRIDQGERLFRFWLNGGPASERLTLVDREALVKNEKPMALSFYPSGEGARPAPGVPLSDNTVQLSALKQAADGDGYVVRLFNPTASKRTTTVAVPSLGVKQKQTLGAYEIRSLRLDPSQKTLCEGDLLERPA